MSTHRKIEYALFIIGTIGFLSAVYFIITNTDAVGFMGLPALYYLTAFLGIATLFAKLHVYHLFDGKRANQIVLACASAGLLLGGYIAFIDYSAFISQNLHLIFGINLILAVLALILRKDFRTQ